MNIEDWLLLQGAAAGWLSAFGTIAAAGAAVWLGSQDIRRRRMEQHEARHVLNSFVRPECVALLQRITTVIHELERPELKGQFGTLEGAIKLEQMRTIAVAPALTLSIAHLERLSHLGPDRAAALARVIGTLPVFCDALMSAAQDPSPEPVIQQQIRMASSYALGLARLIESDLVHANGLGNDVAADVRAAGYYGAVPASDRLRRLLQQQREQAGKGEVS